jgi:hypothetical protein
MSEPQNTKAGDDRTAEDKNIQKLTGFQTQSTRRGISAYAR